MRASSARWFRFQSASNTADYSEYIAQSEPSEAGDIMVVDQEHSEKVRRSSTRYEENILGVITTTGTGYNNDDCPGDAIEEDRLSGKCERQNSPNWANVGMLGQVDVKVTTENGPINPGDRISSSSIAGVGMKSTQAGQIVGRALSGYNESDPSKVGKVRLLVSPSYFDPGTITEADNSIEDLMIESENTAPYTAQIPFAKEGQAKEASNFGKYSIQSLVSGVVDSVGKFATALVANLKAGAIVSDEVATTSLTANQAAIGDLTAGNATIDILTVEKIKANEIEGMDVMVADALASFDMKTLEANVLAQIGQGLTFEGQDVNVLGALTVDKSATVLIDLNVLGKITGGNGLSISGPSEFVAETLFEGPVTFKISPLFNKDTAGFALIKKDQRLVEIVFEREYEQAPIVSANPVWEIDEASLDTLSELGVLIAPKQEYIVANVSSKGFTIVLEEPALLDLKFTWTAIAVKEAKTFESNQTPYPTATPSPTPSETPTSSPSPSPTPTASPSPTPGPTTTPEVSPSPSIQPSP
jgi:hypothetical protein